ncbi:helix-turn-helix domain-containing protein [Leucobacter tardus]|uniref:Helix-turn-helix domain-containing protein n=1 Tax=Leucobacter tardus TaxID=501483 RepID=A0A939QED5_9MICO|nr:PucR family transcriptional regulator [Leucobacter tardus]MBO2988643.1 helix-turn-helix domain-containing protein [Leucobacter tardus]
MADAAWQQLLERVRADIPDLLQEFLRELGDHEGYTEGDVPQEDLERTALQAFDLFLDRLANQGEAEVWPDFPRALGRRRARQGLRIDQFTEAVRINFRLIWRALDRAAHPDLVDELVANGERVLTVVERYATEVQRSFLDETQLMAQFHRSARERALSRLFSGHADADELGSIAELLGIRRHEVYEMFALESAGLTEQDRKRMADSAAYSYEDGELTFLFRPRRGIADWTVSHPDADGAYLSRIDGIGKLAHAAVVARRLAEVRTRPGPFTLKDGFHRLIATGARDGLAGFEHELIGPFAEVPAEEQNRFAVTVHAFMRSGSIQQAADVLFVHRNTVFKRMRAFAAVTGLDVRIPRDAAIAFLLLPEPTGVQINTER